MTLKAEKIAGIIQKGTPEIIQFSLKDLKIGFIATIDVTVTNDLSIAKIYVSSLGQKPREGAGMKAPDRSRGYLRSELARRMTVRKVLELIFGLDNFLERGNKIERIVSEINKQMKMKP